MVISRLARFFSNTKLEGECWIWEGCRNTDGYARVSYKGDCNGKLHRIVYQLTHLDEDIKGKVVRHSCDHPLCIRPDHLLSGTVEQNVQDRDIRERNGWAKLSHNQVKAARTLFQSKEFGIKELAVMFGVKYNTMHSLLTYRHWKSIV